MVSSHGGMKNGRATMSRQCRLWGDLLLSAEVGHVWHADRSRGVMPEFFERSTNVPSKNEIAYRPENVGCLIGPKPSSRSTAVTSRAVHKDNRPPRPFARLPPLSIDVNKPANRVGAGVVSSGSRCQAGATPKRDPQLPKAYS